jgi:Trk-type K+ transport system membrane component
MKLKNQTRRSENQHWSPEQIRQALVFWLFWLAFVCLSAIAIIALLTDWPGFLHEPNYYFR